VTGSARRSFAQRTITSQPKYGATIDVEVSTHFAGVLDFAQGAVGTLVASFDVWSSNAPRLEIYGSQGTLSLPDPNEFGGPVRLRRADASEWSEMPLSHANTHNARGLGLADMANAIRTERPHRASGALAYHVLDVMEAVEKASREARHMDIASTCERPAPLPVSVRTGGAGI
jgi:predicted dehydrogenase